ncbi:hypothetical protein HKBW3C_02861, partial [Candidatus Hakubella thermalkaliphila]
KKVEFLDNFYKDLDDLLKSLGEKVIAPAEKQRQQLKER